MPRLFFVAAAALTLCAAPSRADVVYTTLSSFQAAAPGLTVDNFNTPFSGGVTLARPGYTVTGVTQPFYNYSSFNTLTSTTTNSLGYTTNVPQFVTFTFASAINAFGLYVDDYGTTGSPANFEYKIGSGPVQVFTTTALNGTNGATFFRGILTTSAFTSISLRSTASGDVVGLDDVRYGTVAPPAVPAPAGLVLGLVGLGSFAGLRLRRRAA